jgi:hypothetical protein
MRSKKKKTFAKGRVEQWWLFKKCIIHCSTENLPPNISAITWGICTKSV